MNHFYLVFTMASSKTLQITEREEEYLCLAGGVCLEQLGRRRETSHIQETCKLGTAM